MTSSHSITIDDAINLFYQWKATYENNYRIALKSNAITSSGRATARGRKPRTVKPNCICCKRPVGSVFSITVVQEEDASYRHFKASCGNTADPCSLNMDLKVDTSSLLDSQIAEWKRRQDQLKREIIKLKNNSLFFDDDNVMQSFQQVTEQLASVTEQLGFHVETNVLRNFNPEKAAQLQEDKRKFFTAVQSFQNKIHEFMALPNASSSPADSSELTAALEQYCQELLPAATTIRTRTYGVNEVQFDEPLGQYFLIQRPLSLESQELKGIAHSIVALKLGDCQTTKRTKQTLTKKKTAKGKKEREKKEGEEGKGEEEEGEEEKEEGKEEEEEEEKEENTELQKRFGADGNPYYLLPVAPSNAQKKHTLIVWLDPTTTWALELSPISDKYGSKTFFHLASRQTAPKPSEQEQPQVKQRVSMNCKFGTWSDHAVVRDRVLSPEEARELVEIKLRIQPEGFLVFQNGRFLGFFPHHCTRDELPQEWKLRLPSFHEDKHTPFATHVKSVWWEESSKTKWPLLPNDAVLAIQNSQEVATKLATESVLANMCRASVFVSNLPPSSNFDEWVSTQDEVLYPMLESLDVTKATPYMNTGFAYVRFSTPDRVKEAIAHIETQVVETGEGQEWSLKAKPVSPPLLGNEPEQPQK